jgi:comEA protein
MKNFKSMILVLATILAGGAILAAVPAQAGTSDGPAGVVNINTAGQAQLELLPGIGPSMAKAILEYRQKSPFRSIDELDKVKGIGPKLVQKLRSKVVLEGETTMKVVVKPPRQKKGKD